MTHHVYAASQSELDILTAYPDLTRAGFAPGGSPLDCQEVRLVHLWLKWQVARLAGRRCTWQYSYGLKHVAEAAMGVYVSNGTLIAAAILGGFPIRRFRERSNPNCDIKMPRDLHSPGGALLLRLTELAAGVR